MRQLIVRVAVLGMIICAVGCGGTTAPQVVQAAETEAAPKVTIADGDTAEEIWTKGLVALGGPEKLDRWSVGRILFRENFGDLPKPGADVTSEETFQLPGQFKTVVRLRTPGGKEGTRITVGNNGRGWERDVDGTMIEQEDLNSTMKFHYYAAFFYYNLFFLGRPSMTVTLLGEGQSDGRPAALVNMQANRDQEILYFEKSSALLIRHVRTTVDSKTDKEVTTDTFLGNYKFVQGGWVPMRAQSYRDGRLLGESTVLELQFFDKVDGKEFAKP